MTISGAHFRIFMALLLAVQAGARNVFVSLWYGTFFMQHRLPDQDLNENDEIGSISDVLNMGSSPRSMYYVLYWHRLS